MYVPDAFQETRPERLVAAMREIQFAALVTPVEGRIEITHAPMLLRDDGPQMVLESHVARGNPHWRALDEGAQSVAIFQGPQDYVSPSWYPSKSLHGKVVPTWVYIAVHAHGVLEPMQEEAWLRAHLERLTERNEAGRQAPWAVSDAPDGFVRSLSRGIVGLQLTVERLEGAWKVNQHKAPPDRAGTGRGLRQSGDAGHALAAALAERLEGRP
jgi:transcriptional regulator